MDLLIDINHQGDSLLIHTFASIKSRSIAPKVEALTCELACRNLGMTFILHAIGISIIWRQLRTLFHSRRSFTRVSKQSAFYRHIQLSSFNQRAVITNLYVCSICSYVCNEGGYHQTSYKVVLTCFHTDMHDITKMLQSVGFLTHFSHGSIIQNKVGTTWDKQGKPNYLMLAHSQQDARFCLHSLVYVGKLSVNSTSAGFRQGDVQRMYCVNVCGRTPPRQNGLGVPRYNCTITCCLSKTISHMRAHVHAMTKNVFIVQDHNGVDNEEAPPIPVR